MRNDKMKWVTADFANGMRLTNTGVPINNRLHRATDVGDLSVMMYDLLTFVYRTSNGCDSPEGPSRRTNVLIWDEA